MNSILISGMGRSGTLFLSTMMNRSKQWTIKHEPGPSKNPQKYFKMIQGRFDKDFYGEVNSYLRYVFNSIKAGRKGIIRRDPAAIFLSIANRKRDITKGLDAQLEGLNKSFRIIDKAINNNMYTIIFEKMVTDIDYINNVIKDFGILDVKLTKSDLSRRINQNKSIKFKNFVDLPNPVIKKFRKSLGWFSEEHGYSI